MNSLREAFEGYCKLAGVSPTLEGRSMTLLKASFVTGLRLGMGIASMEPEQAMNTMARWGAEVDEFYQGSKG